MKPKNQKGSALIELMAAMPLVATFILIILQFSMLFTQAIHDVAMAEAEALKRVNEWGLSHAGQGFERPCLFSDDGSIHLRTVVQGGRPVTIGAGTWGSEIGVPQEVKIVRQPVCADW